MFPSSAQVLNQVSPVVGPPDVPDTCPEAALDQVCGIPTLAPVITGSGSAGNSTWRPSRAWPLAKAGTMAGMNAATSSEPTVTASSDERPCIGSPPGVCQ